MGDLVERLVHERLKVMKNPPKMPVLELERETGDLAVYSDIDNLRQIVEEFWDILDQDFTFWDAEGFRLKFADSFLKGSDDAEQLLPNDAAKVRALLHDYLHKRKPDLTISDDATLSELYEQI